MRERRESKIHTSQNDCLSVEIDIVGIDLRAVLRVAVSVSALVADTSYVN